MDVFPSHELLGWYTTGDVLAPDDIDIHKQVWVFFLVLGWFFPTKNKICLGWGGQIPGENPWLLLLHTAVLADQRELPIEMHALETRVVEGTAQAAFVK